MLNKKEREERKKQIGASEIYKILNFNSKQAQDLWEYKIGLKEQENFTNNSMMAGNILEEDNLKFYEKKYNVDLILNERIEHPKIKGLVVSLDSRERETNIPVENKIINEKTYQEWLAKKTYNAITDFEEKLNIPKSYYCQIQTQMAVLNSEIGKLNIATLTDEEVIDPLNVKITDIHNKVAIVFQDIKLQEELLKRAEYLLGCIKHKKRPNELEFLEKYVF